MPNILDINTGVKYCNDDSYLYFVHTEDPRAQEKWGAGDDGLTQHAHGILAVGIINNIRTSTSEARYMVERTADGLVGSCPQCSGHHIGCVNSCLPTTDLSVVRSGGVDQAYAHRSTIQKMNSR